jgi:hypothetical protein
VNRSIYREREYPNRKELYSACFEYNPNYFNDRSQSEKAMPPKRMTNAAGHTRSFDRSDGNITSSQTTQPTSRLLSTSIEQTSNQSIDDSTQQASSYRSEDEENSIPNEPRQTSNGHSGVWEYMKKDAEDKARCNLCAAILSRKNCGTTGLRKHLLQVHQLQQFAVCSTRKRPMAKRVSVERKKQLDSLVIRCIIEDGRSFGDMRRPGLLKVFNNLIPGKSGCVPAFLCLFLFLRRVFASASAYSSATVKSLGRCTQALAQEEIVDRSMARCDL